MRTFSQNAFSLLEILIILSIITILYGIFFSEFKFDINTKNDELVLKNILKKGRYLAMQRFENVFLTKENENLFTIRDNFGEKISENYLIQNVYLCNVDTGENYEKIKISPSGFFQKFTANIDDIQYFIDPLSGNVVETKN